jgi:hypothetical protein
MFFFKKDFLLFFKISKIAMTVEFEKDERYE